MSKPVISTATTRCPAVEQPSAASGELQVGTQDLMLTGCFQAKLA